jgi:hypothetical protein
VNENIQRHSTSMSFAESFPTQVDAGGDMLLKFKVVCLSNCSLQNGIVKITDDSNAIIERIKLTSSDETSNGTATFAVKAPNAPGEHTWNAVYKGEKNAGLLHEESSTQFSFVVKPHVTSMVVWDVPSPIQLNDKFTIKVGVRCSAECNLGGLDIEILDHTQALIATAKLSDIPMSEATPLHWAEVELRAPGAEGCYNWSVRFAKPDLALAHEGSCCEFAFVTVRPPEHVVTVQIVDQVEKTPVANAQVIMHPYRGFSDERGIAIVKVTQGEYDLWIPKNEKYMKFRMAVKVDGDTEIKAELKLIPEDPS